MFIDEVKVTFIAGNGGSGIVSWRREKYIPKGGPFGGDGGDGGNIILTAVDNISTLSDFRNRKDIKAETGERGGTRDLHGKNGEDLVVNVPVGTIVSDAETGEFIYDLAYKNDSFILCKGGKGGFGNAHFVSSTRQAPNFAELGDTGERKIVKLELKLVADICLIGMPNAGKSTLIKTLTNVKPKIASYPFTTLVPNLGVMDHKGKSLVIEDVPGLIEGASEGKGLGTTFLKHIERTRVILHLLDCGELDKIVENYQVIRKELENFSKDLAKKEEVIILTKTDLLDKEMLEYLTKELNKKIKKKKIITLSSQGYVGIEQLKDFLIENFSQEEVDEKKEEKGKIRIYNLKDDIDPNYFKIIDKGNMIFEVKGERIEQIVRMTDVRYTDAIMRVFDVMEKMGIIKKINNIIEKKYKNDLRAHFFEVEGEIDENQITPKVIIAGKEFSLDKVLFM
ncbi:MAG: GTPase ObgE [Candidatus Gracilibacteria bacterium]|nr:GTPase ObgE [Candidatus Gracilibacteria bacterium]MDD3120691.1 GTPase ObgE [Candidatus Gracilibacteria bacterium]MDD4530108.1 GTPase ObgE [Candidatus Gracilibacteria bacterium]